jgi:hypothetical protein
MRLGVLQDRAAQGGKAWVDERFAAGQVEEAAAEIAGLGGDRQQAAGRKLEGIVRRGGEHAVSARQVAAVGDVQPALAQPFHAEHLGPTCLRPCRMLRDAGERPLDVLPARGVRATPLLSVASRGLEGSRTGLDFAKDRVRSGVGNEPVGAGRLNEDRCALEFETAPGIEHTHAGRERLPGAVSGEIGQSVGHVDPLGPRLSLRQSRTAWLSPTASCG